MRVRFVALNIVIAILALLFTVGPCAVHCSTVANHQTNCPHHGPAKTACMHDPGLPEAAFFVRGEQLQDSTGLIQTIMRSHLSPPETNIATTACLTITARSSPSPAFTVLRV